MQRKKNVKKRRPEGPLHRHFESVASAAASGVYLAVCSNFSLNLLGHLFRKEYDRVVDAEVNPNDYDDAMSFRDDYLSAELMSKFPAWDIGVDRRAVAINRFIESERLCKETNSRLSKRRVNGLYSHYTPEAIISMASRKIARLLGPFNWDLAEPHFAFGPGATFDLPKRRGDAYYKYGSKRASVTEDCAVLAYTALRRVPRWFQHVVSLTGEDPIDFLAKPLSERIAACFDIVEGNRITTVPKDAKKDRTIAIEPTMNGYIQHGLGGLIRSRLRRVGIDLNDQSWNQSLARLGSINGSVATIDLSSASDTVSMKLVEELMPSDWFTAIQLCRSPVGILPDGSKVVYQKVSSMGNGVTFELESLIFWALASAVCTLFHQDERLLGIYGDDIVVPTYAVSPLVFVLNYCGFSCNMKKTWTEGPFRESCGKHYFRGTDVTPLYIRKDVCSTPDLIWLCNQIRRWSRMDWGLDGRMKFVYDYLVSVLPSSLRHPSIPDGLGDTSLFGDLDECRPAFSRKWWAYTVRLWYPSLRTRRFADVPFLLRQLSVGSSLLCDDIQQYSAWSDWKKQRVVAIGSGVPLPESHVTWRRSDPLPVSSWGSYGPWIGA